MKKAAHLNSSGKKRSPNKPAEPKAAAPQSVASSPAAESSVAPKPGVQLVPFVGGAAVFPAPDPVFPPRPRSSKHKEVKLEIYKP